MSRALLISKEFTTSQLEQNSSEDKNNAKFNLNVNQ
jgi:hypothetical protein